MTTLKLITIALVLALVPAVEAYGETSVMSRLTTAYCMGVLIDQSASTKLSPSKVRSAQERFFALRPAFERAADESKGTLTETMMDSEFKRAELARQRLGAVEYFTVVDMCDRHADQFRSPQ